MGLAIYRGLTLPLPSIYCYLSLMQSPDGKYVASGALDGFVNVFDVATEKLLHTLEGMQLNGMILCTT